MAREHRNHFVHGIYITLGARDPYEAEAVLIPAKPINGRSQVPSHAKLSDMRPVAEHIHALAMFAREVMVGFDANGNRAERGRHARIGGATQPHIALADVQVRHH